MILSDVIAGLTIGFMVIPQGLAYARVATLPPQYGLYSAYIGAFVYILFGTAKDITLGPTAIVSLLVGQAVQSAATVPEKISWALTLSLLVGGGQSVFGFLGLGILVDFISRPVISGFVSSSSLVIASEQLCHLFATKCSNGNIISVYQNTFTDIGPSIKSHWPDLFIGLTSAIICFILQKLGQNFGNRYRVVWIVTTGRFLVVVSLSILLSYLLYVKGVFFGGHSPSSCVDGGTNFPCSPFTLLGHVQGGISEGIGIPNVTFSTIQEVGSFLPIIALVSYLESISIAQAFARKNGYRVDPNQELVAIGMANFTGSFFGAFPVTGSFSRSAVLASSGVKTPLSGIFTGVIVILALEVLSGVFFWIPSAVLAGIIISAVFPMFEGHVIVRLWKTNKVELCVLSVSFFGCIFLGVALGILISTIISILLSFYLGNVGDKIIEETQDKIVWQYEGPLNFFVARNFMELFIARVLEYKRPNVVVDMSFVTYLDDSGLCSLEEACGVLKKQNYKIHFLNVRENVFGYLSKSGLLKEGKDVENGKEGVGKKIVF